MSISTLRNTAYTRRDTLLAPFKKKKKATARPRNISQLRASGGATRQMTRGEKQAYAEARGIRYTPRASSGTAGVPSWTKNYARINGNKVYRQYNTQTFYYQKGNTVYRHDRRNNRYYLLDNGVMSGGVTVPYSRVPKWVRDTARRVSS